MIVKEVRSAHLEDKQNEVPTRKGGGVMSIDEQMIDSAVALTKSLTRAAENFVVSITLMRDEAIAMEADLNERKSKITREFDRLKEELLAKRQEHRQVEQSIGVLKRQLAELEAERQRLQAMFKRASA